MNNNEEILVTPEGLKKIKDEYKDLVETKRSQIAERIQSAREMGDLSENAAYHTAKEDQSFLEGRILELKQILKHAKIIEQSGEKDLVTIGSKVILHLEEDEETFWIVGALEADPASNKISHESPLGQALIGKKVGDIVEVEAPMGSIKYKIKNIG